MILALGPYSLSSIKAEKFSFNFPKKEEILKLIKLIGEKRNILCYGKRQPEPILEELIENFNKLKSLFVERGLIEIEDL